MTYVLDSNIISYLLKGNTEVRRRISKTSVDGDKIAIPQIVYFEVKRWLLVVGATAKQQAFERLLRDEVVLTPMVQDVWEAAANLYAETRKAGRPAADADLLIASFCIVNGYTLSTNNTKHFQDFNGLNLVNWA